MLYTGFCRAFQAGMKLGNYFVGYRTPELIEGENSVLRLAEHIKGRGINSVLVVAGPTQTKMGRLDGMFESMKAANLNYTVFCGVQPNPTDDNVEEGLKAYKEGKCEGIVAFGGGSPMDCAKGIAARVAQPKKSVAQLQGLLKVGGRVPPIFAIPTTSGTGSETTIAAVITESATHHKASINDPHLIPLTAVLDPILTASMSPRTTAICGMDALSHAVEAYTNGTYCTKLERNLSREAVKLIYDNLYTCYEHGDNLEARANMQRAAFKAGRAFTRGTVGYVHAVGHTLSALYGMAHGQAMATLLPVVMRRFGTKVYKSLSELADCCGIGGSSEKEKAENFIAWMDDMNSKMGISAKFDVIQEKDIPAMVEWALKEANPLYPVPVVLGRKELEQLIRSVMA